MDPYVYPGTSILKNRRDIRDNERLQTFEADASARRLTELQERPLAGSFDVNHLRQIHRHIFQDVYAWAGQIRTVNLSRAGQFPYAFPNRIEQALNGAFNRLRGERHLASQDLGQFATRAAHYLGEINAAHPFREGNGRTQREFVRQLANRNGYALDWSRTSRQQMYEASRLSFQHGDNSGLDSVLRATLYQEKERGLQRPSELPPARSEGSRPEDHREIPVRREKALAAAREAAAIVKARQTPAKDHGRER